MSGSHPAGFGSNSTAHAARGHAAGALDGVVSSGPLGREDDEADGQSETLYDRSPLVCAPGVRSHCALLAAMMTPAAATTAISTIRRWVVRSARWMDQCTIRPTQLTQLTRLVVPASRKQWIKTGAGATESTAVCGPAPRNPAIPPRVVLSSSHAGGRHGHSAHPRR
jgi:hypothetical protein